MVIILKQDGDPAVVQRLLEGHRKRWLAFVPYIAHCPIGKNHRKSYSCRPLATCIVLFLDLDGGAPLR
jgi:hypothetical protein